MSIEKNFILVDGVVTKAFPNGMFLVHLDNDLDVLTIISGKIRYRSIRVVRGDRVRVELSSYDLSKGRIIYRYPIKRNDDDLSTTDD
uniref:Translation initiation factor IF-1, chloroplastic n=1 Tax=Pilgerodendron uviferum TaxID=103979 RepID=A0A6J4AHN8_9CONI|nr:translation initiation factor 1 [Pilgerodendron uviferum]BBN66856.1 translation initiation factor 1 [Pilgerodendron uviferum]